MLLIARIDVSYWDFIYGISRFVTILHLSSNHGDVIAEFCNDVTVNRVPLFLALPRISKPNITNERRSIGNHVRV